MSSKEVYTLLAGSHSSLPSQFPSQSRYSIKVYRMLLHDYETLDLFLDRICLQSWDRLLAFCRRTVELNQERCAVQMGLVFSRILSV